MPGQQLTRRQLLLLYGVVFLYAACFMAQVGWMSQRVVRAVARAPEPPLQSGAHRQPTAPAHRHPPTQRQTHMLP
jgi:hypothetical protein